MAEAVRECPSCALEVSKDAEECPYCSYEFPPPATGSLKTVAIIMALLMAWPLFKLLTYVFG